MIENEVITKQKNLQSLAIEITNCRKCDALFKVYHAREMNRGSISKIIVIGIEPGNTELKEGKAFSGLGGKKLMSWLIASGVGNNADEIFSKVYFTSICKCKIEKKHNFNRAASNCNEYLLRQLSILKPKLCITLGNDPLRIMFNVDADLSNLVGKAVYEKQLNATLFPVLQDDCLVIPLPHPSPISRWTNDENNQKLLECALDLIKKESLYA